MKSIKITSILIASLFLLSSCSQPDIKDSIDNTNQTDITNSDEKHNTDNSETVVTTVNPRDEQKVYSAKLHKVNDITEYNGDELSLTMSVENDGDAFTQAFFLYVNGQINEYSTDEFPDKSTYHIYDLPEDGTKEITLHFTPYNCKKGEKAIISLVSMITPDYTLEDMSYANFGLHHNIARPWPFEISINQDSPESPYNKISQERETVEISEEYAKEQNYTSLNNVTTFRMYQTDPLENYMTAENTLTFDITAAGKEERDSGKYLVGIYINHELQKAFGDNYYALCDADGEHEVKITANIDVTGLSGLNHIYMVAAPYDPNDVEFGVAPEKTATKLLFVGSEEEMQEYSPIEQVKKPLA
ncbi:MAG: hypothetical protein K2K41_09990 [Ruminiclostridium sp.]|nr:hypothetical protein [Ruminiclostridium sp.]